MKKRNEEKNPFGFFDLNDFKKWMDHQKDTRPKIEIIGLHVESKANFKRLLAKMEICEGDLHEVAKDFRENGGIISETDGYKFLIDVDSGSFIIHRMHVKRT